MVTGIGYVPDKALSADALIPILYLSKNSTPLFVGDQLQQRTAYRDIRHNDHDLVWKRCTGNPIGGSLHLLAGWAGYAWVRYSPDPQFDLIATQS